MAVTFFDEGWYLNRNPDVRAAVEAGDITAEQHFEQYGINEGRSPSPLFDPEYYLAQNPDVRAAVESGTTTAYRHFEEYGHEEGRDASPYFNVEYYLANNPDVDDAVEDGDISAYEHYHSYGMSEGRSPLASFDADYYLAENPDVAAAVEAGHISAARHFMTYGISENRDLSGVLSVSAYLAANADVRTAVNAGQTTGLEHMLTYGVREQRDLGWGVSSIQFARDPVYTEAIKAGDMDAALARITEVSPFLPSFDPPEGFTLPADWPIPQGFTPLEGVMLSVPEGWVPATPVRLPDYFEQPFTAVIADGVVSFPDTTGEIRVINENGQAGFAHGGFIAAGSVPLNGTATVQLAAEQVLIGAYGDIGQLDVTGEGSVIAEGTAEADTIDASEWTAVNLEVRGMEGDDTITIADTHTAVGGAGADTFVIAAEAGTGTQIIVDDYNFEQGDVIDLSGVEGLNILEMEARGAEIVDGSWVWDGYTGNSLGLWFTDDAANVQITGARSETVKFIVPEIEGFEDYETLQLKISDFGRLYAGNEASEILRGGSGTQLLYSGEQADVLSGGADNDLYLIGGVEHSSLDSMDWIAGLVVGEDVIVTEGAIIPGGLANGGTVANLQAGTVAAALTAEVFTANRAAYFTVGEGEATRSFIALNDGTAGFDANTDAVIEVTGVQGDLANLTVVGVPELGSPGVETQVQQLLAA